MASRVETAEEAASDLARVLEIALHNDDGAAARAHLAAGRAIYYGNSETPAGVVMKEYPDGRREFVRFDADGEHVVQAVA